MSRPTIDDIRGVGDFATTYQWYLDMVSVPAIGSFPDSADLNLRVQTTALPKVTNEPITVALRGHRIKQPGLANYGGTIQMTAVETVDNIISNFLREWREACYTVRTGNQGTKAEVEATIEITRTDRQDNDLFGYRLYGCWLEDYDLGQLVSDGSAVFIPSFTLAFDYFEEF